MRTNPKTVSPHVVTVDERRTQAMSDLTRLVLECEHLYPGIDIWFHRKVAPGLSSGSRVAVAERA
jgi:hypothetical protein